MPKFQRSDYIIRRVAFNVIYNTTMAGFCENYRGKASGKRPLQTFLRSTWATILITVHNLICA